MVRGMRGSLLDPTALAKGDALGNSTQGLPHTFQCGVLAYAQPRNCIARTTLSMATMYAASRM
jgi:hypothetical protein